MTPEQRATIFVGLTETNRALAKALSQARQTDSHYDHHLIQNDSAPTSERLRYLLAQTQQLLASASLSMEECEQTMDQLHALLDLCRRSIYAENQAVNLYKSYE